MCVIGYDILCIRGDSTINEFIIVHVLLNESKMNINLLKNS